MATTPPVASATRPPEKREKSSSIQIIPEDVKWVTKNPFGALQIETLALKTESFIKDRPVNPADSSLPLLVGEKVARVTVTLRNNGEWSYRILPYVKSKTGGAVMTFEVSYIEPVEGRLLPAGQTVTFVWDIYVSTAALSGVNAQGLEVEILPFQAR